MLELRFLVLRSLSLLISWSKLKMSDALFFAYEVVLRVDPRGETKLKEKLGKCSGFLEVIITQL